jgi:PAS domain S-box-containing protein
MTERQDLLRVALEAARVGVWDFNVLTGTVTWSPNLEEIHGLPPGSFQGTLQSVLEGVHPDDRQSFHQAIQHSLAQQQPYSKEYRITWRDGSIRWLQGLGRVLTDDSGQPMRMVGVCMDVTDRKQAEESLQQARANLEMRVHQRTAELYQVNQQLRAEIAERQRAEETRRESEAKWGSLVQNAPEFIFTMDRAGTILSINHTLPGHPPEQVIGRSGLSFVTPEQHAEVRELLDHVVRTGQPESYEAMVLGPDGTMVCYQTRVAAVKPEHGEPILIAVATDITERKKAEESFRMQARVLENMAEGVFVADPSGIILYTNPAEDAMFGYEPGELIGRHVSVLRASTSEENGHFVAHITEQMKTRSFWAGELQNRKKDGSVFTTDARITTVDRSGQQHWVCVQEDVTERRRLEEQVRQAHKMEAIGRLAGGVAHDFNNLMTVVSGYGELLQAGMSPDSPWVLHVREILKAAERASNLTAQLLAFGRKAILAPRVLDLNALLRDLEKNLLPLIGEDVELRTVLEPALGRVKVDPGQMHQVILNLAVNARDAMPQGGQLTLATANVELDEAFAHNHAEIAPGSYVLLAVSDTGYGMSAEVQAHLFEPFFTTKEVGKGTGLGLSTVYGIVKQSGGHVEAESAPGRGSTFKIYLPRVQETSSPSQTRAVSVWPGGSETVFVVEDEVMVRDFTCRVLRESGYTVLAAASGDLALRETARQKGPIHLLVTDVVMPGMSGRDLAERLALQHPRLRVLYLSGYTDDAILRHGVVATGAAFLQKPFTPEALARKVREILDG